jgi:proteasome lid subunit RPN8/RPN11
MWTLLMVVALSVDARSENLQLLAALRDLRTRGLMQTDQREVAAFVVRRDDGSLNIVMWPHSANFRSERYEGAVPAGTVAIAHTHPPQADQRPSRGDIEQAKKIGMPIYVVTRWNLWVADAHGDVHELVARTDWSR